jgi:hypothetical protein
VMAKYKSPLKRDGKVGIVAADVWHRSNSG